MQNSNVGGYNSRGFVEVLAAAQTNLTKEWFQVGGWVGVVGAGSTCVLMRVWGGPTHQRVFRRGGCTELVRRWVGEGVLDDPPPASPTWRAARACMCTM